MCSLSRGAGESSIEHSGWEEERKGEIRFGTMRLCEASPFCVRARIQLCTCYIVARCALMRQWIQDHVSSAGGSPVGANLNRVTKLSNLYLCIHTECNEIGARAQVVLVLSFVKQADTVRARLSQLFTPPRRGKIPAKSRLIPTWPNESVRIADPCRGNLSWLVSPAWNNTVWKMRNQVYITK